MNEDLKIIKKYYGEKMMHFCRTQFPTMLEKKGLLSNLILSSFEPTKYLYEDIDVYGKSDDFVNYINSLSNNIKKEKVDYVEKPEDLMEKAGYKLYECKKEEDIQYFKKYFSEYEELCTFHGGRLNRCHVFFAIKENVDLIKRENFENPDRQDEYGTSVISIQFTKDYNCTLSIKNRYNHTVTNPDATFSNNLDNIIENLTDSFQKHYNLKQTHLNSFELKNYVKAKDGKFYRYNLEKNNIYYCGENIVIDNFEVKRFEKEKYILMDYFLVDLVKKEIETYDWRTEDGLLNGLGIIDKILITNEDKSKSVEFHFFEKKEPLSIKINKNNAIIKVVDPNVEVIPNRYFYLSNNLEEIYLKKAKEIKDSFLMFNDNLKVFEADNLEKIGDDFLIINKEVEFLNLPNVREIKNRFLLMNKIINKIYAPNLELVGKRFLEANQKLEIVELPKLNFADESFLERNKNINIIKLDSLVEVRDKFLRENLELQELVLPNIKSIGDFSLEFNNKLKNVDLHNIEKIGNNFLRENTTLKELKFSQLNEVGHLFLNDNLDLRQEISNSLGIKVR